MIRALLILCCACTAPVGTSPAAPPKVVPVAPPPEAFVATPVAYAAPIETTVKRYCPTATAPPLALAGRGKSYDFSPIPIDSRLGYTATTQPRASYARDPEAIRSAIAQQTSRLADCIRVARGKLRVRSTRDILDVFVELEVDPFGAISDVKVEAPPQFEACLQATLLAVRVPRQAPRTTHASIRLDFSSMSSATPLKVLPAAPPAASERGHCFLATDPLPVDEPALTPVVIDFDPAPAPRRLRRWPSRCARHDVDKAQIRRAVMAVHGDLRSCYLGALARQPDLEGTLATQFVVGALGAFTQITVSGVGDAALHACITDTLASTAAASQPEGPVAVSLPFTLERSLTGWDREAVAAELAERARTATTADASCRARAALVGAYLGIEPGGTQAISIPIDPRAMLALDSLAAFIAANPNASLAGCIDELAPVLVRLGQVPMKSDDSQQLQWGRGRGLREAIDRSQQIVELLPRVERSLLPFIADGLAILDDHEAALGAYVRLLSLGDDDPANVTHAADGYARVTRNRDDGLLWDDCSR
ncbi:MAG: AgmX/PglI C-terminal domain-containing protein [Deltaproteobacteria bacterium]|nr:AgmX/PglI C-terminal domain-containing protein [Deltaproteobacteria bacterium]